MVPAAFVVLDALPLTPNGKLDRAALPAPDGGRRPSWRRSYAPPSTPVEEQLAAIWREVLRHRPRRSHDDFFDLGGHSLLAVKMLARVQTELDVEIPLGSIFSGPTIGELADAVTLALVGNTGDDDLSALLRDVEAVEG